MRELGLSSLRAAFAVAALLAACKAAPEPAPAEASSPAGAVTAEPAPPAPTPPDGDGASAKASGAASAPTAGPAAERSYAEGTKSISATVGERFTVALPSNITIPMKWRIEPAPDPTLLTLIEERHHDEPPKGCDGCTGYGGTRLFHFEAKGAGKTTLHFALKPLTNPGAPAQKSVTIEVVTAR